MICYVIICGVLAALYFYSTRDFDYWEKRGVKHEKAIPILGNYADIFMGRKNIMQYVDTMYTKYRNEKVFGFFAGTVPSLLLIDPELVKRVLCTHFQAFPTRGFMSTDNDYSSLELLRRNLLVVEGDAWKLLRHYSSPAFTSVKIKAMFPLIAERAQRLQERVRGAGCGGEADGAGELDARDLMARYTTDFIGACGLGIDPDTLNDEHSEFRKLGIQIFLNRKFQYHFRVKSLVPNLLKNIKTHNGIEKPFCKLVNEVMSQKGHKPTSRNDFLDLMLEIKNKGKMECESMEKMKPDGTPERVSMELDDDLIAAQVFIFFSAGFETSSFVSSYTLHLIAYHPEEQRKIQADIDRALAKSDHALCYDAVKEMTYLEWALKEGLRMMPPASTTMRMCRQKYNFEDLGFTIDKGTRVMISINALQNDPRYWDCPEQFRPERFSPESNEPRHKFAYLPFGAGPRACIGERLGMVQSMAGLAAILARFSVAPAPRSVRRPLVSTTTFITQHIPAGLPLIFTPRT